MQDAAYYWNQFLQTGAPEDYVNYRNAVKPIGADALIGPSPEGRVERCIERADEGIGPYGAPI